LGRWNRGFHDAEVGGKFWAERGGETKSGRESNKTELPVIQFMVPPRGNRIERVQEQIIEIRPMISPLRAPTPVKGQGDSSSWMCVEESQRTKRTKIIPGQLIPLFSSEGKRESGRKFTLRRGKKGRRKQ